MSKFLKFYTGLLILTIIVTTINTFLFDRSILQWAAGILLYSFLWAVVFITNKYTKDKE
jgi:cytochrome c biogenesis protein CcdA